MELNETFTLIKLCKKQDNDCQMLAKGDNLTKGSYIFRASRFNSSLIIKCSLMKIHINSLGYTCNKEFSVNLKTIKFKKLIDCMESSVRKPTNIVREQLVVVLSERLIT